jgi:hypothetical protein
MKKYLLSLTAVVLSTIISYPIHAQCNYTTGGNGISKFAGIPIIIDGQMADWSLFLNDADNNSYDNTNGTDLNAPISDAGRDLTRLVITSDFNHLYLYMERAGSSSNKVDFILYMDINNNDFMDSGEPVLQLDWSGSNGTVGVSIHNYVPSATSSSNSISQNLDGSSLWGTLTPRANLGFLGQGSTNGTSMEARIPFNSITTVDAEGVVHHQLNTGDNFKFHLSSINGNISSIPNLNSINDDFGGCVIAPVASSLPVSLLGFQATLKEKNALLNWKTTNHYNFSHFVIEKSTDARNFKQAAIVFAPENSSSENNYNYKDNLLNIPDKAIYYRIQMVDVNGSSSYSETRTVRLTEENKLQISTFPNPSTNELRVMIPEKWQEKMVTYEIYNASGVLMYRYQNKHAAQVQQLNVQHLNSGNYVVKARNGLSSINSKFIKY